MIKTAPAPYCQGLEYEQFGPPRCAHIIKNNVSKCAPSLAAYRKRSKCKINKYSSIFRRSCKCWAPYVHITNFHLLHLLLRMAKPNRPTLSVVAFSDRHTISKGNVPNFLHTCDKHVMHKDKKSSFMYLKE